MKFSHFACISLTLIVFFNGAMPLAAGEQGAPSSISSGSLSTLYVDNFEGPEDRYRRVPRREHCLAKAWEIADDQRKRGSRVTQLYNTPYFAVYKAVTRTGLKLLIHCNQNASLIIAGEADPEINDFLKAASSIGISLKEKAIDSQNQTPAVIINNGQNNAAPSGGGGSGGSAR